jgi:uncharacterized protein YbcI
MNTPSGSMAQRIADAVTRFQTERTGHAPKTVTVVLNDDTLVVTLHEALSPAEIVLSQTPDGASFVRDFHRRLFDSSVGLLREEIDRITGVAIREAAVEVETGTGAVEHAFASGTMVQVFRLANRIAPEAWTGQATNDSVCCQPTA